MKNPAKDYYSILEIDRGASKKEIRKAYLKMVKKYHPDTKSPDSEIDTDKFGLVLEAYKVLSNPKLKEEYDQKFFGTHSIGKTFFVKKEKDQSISEPKIRAKKLFNEGMEAYEAGDYNRAIEFLHIASNLDSSNPLFLTSLGLALSKKKMRLHEARDWCEKAIKLAPYNPTYYINLATVYKEAGLNKMAKRYFDKALELDPDNRKAKEGLGLYEKSDSFKDKVFDFMRKAFIKKEKD